MYDTLEPLIVRCQMKKLRKKYERFCSILVSSSIEGSDPVFLRFEGTKDKLKLCADQRLPCSPYPPPVSFTRYKGYSSS